AVAAGWHGRQWHRQRRLAGIRGRAQRIGETAARQPDLAEQGGQHHAHPYRLLAMLGALQGLRASDERTPSGAAPRERDDVARRNVADRGGPSGVLRLTVGVAQEIGLERLPADGEPVEEGAVVQSLGYKGVSDA